MLFVFLPPSLLFFFFFCKASSITICICIHTVTTTTHQQQICFLLLPLLALPLLLRSAAVCLLLQCCFTGPAGVARVRQHGPDQMVSWLRCSMPGWPASCRCLRLGVIDFLSFSLSLLAWWQLDVARPEVVSQAYTEVCALTFTVMVKETLQDWRRGAWSGKGTTAVVAAAAAGWNVRLLESCLAGLLAVYPAGLQRRRDIHTDRLKSKEIRDVHMLTGLPDHWQIHQQKQNKATCKEEPAGIQQNWATLSRAKEEVKNDFY